MNNNDPAAGALIGYGRKRLRELHRDMGFQNLKTYSNRIDLVSGYSIITTSSQGINKIIILSPSDKKGGSAVEYECFCNCNFAVGQIKEIIPIAGLDYLQIFICQKDKYVLFENILANDFTPWRVNDVVLVMAYNGFLYDCDMSNFDATACTPIKDTVNEVTSEDWRTTFRVLPFCSLSLVKWIKYAVPVAVSEANKTSSNKTMSTN